MANDNQTALMQSIQRKKDRVEELETQLEQKSESGVADGIYNIAVELRVHRYEITEDEKLLAVDREQLMQAYVDGSENTLGQDSEGTKICSMPCEYWYEQKYGTDGK